MTVIERYFVGTRRELSSVYVTDDAGHVLALCEDRADAKKIVAALNGCVDAERERCASIVRRAAGPWQGHTATRSVLDGILRNIERR